MHKLGIVVPYRDRYEQLQTFLQYMTEYLTVRGYTYRIIVVEQDNASAFNRGMLCNIGFKEAMRQRCDYVVFHDVDMLPVDVDYSYSSYPVHLATHNIPFDDYFGGITLFPAEAFQKVDGFSNMYWGWGFEDDDLRYRCIKKKVELDTKVVPYINYNNPTLVLNGENAYVTTENVLNTNRSFSIGITVRGDKLTLDHTKTADIFPLVTIEGYDLSLNYSSFKRFAFQFFDAKNNFHQIYSEVLQNKESFIFVTHNRKEKLVKMYINGELVGEVQLDGALYNYSKVKTIYLGTDPEQSNFYKGAIDTFTIFDRALDQDEIQSIYKNTEYSLTTNFFNYKSSENLVTYYDSRFIRFNKLINLVQNENNGNIVKGYQSKFNAKPTYSIHIPYRRPSKIKTLSHESSGFNGGRWKSDLTRWNELRYTNEVVNGSYIGVEDGLSNCEYIPHSKKRNDDTIHLTVGI